MSIIDKGINYIIDPDNSTTKSLNKYANYFSSENEAKKFSYKNIEPTNSRYKDFKQSHFTAGDIEQFEKFRDTSNSSENFKNIIIKDNIFQDIKISTKIFKSLYWEKYENISVVDIDNTFNYIFNKFKKGIYVKILDNKLRVFLPFSKNEYVNEWGDRMKVKPPGNLLNFFSDISEKQGYKFREKSVNTNPFRWVGNGALIRYESPLNEGDSGVSHMHDMLLELCKNRKLPDIEFFINRRDFPLLKRNETEAYDDIFGKDFPLVSHNYEKYCPILGGSVTSDFADISIPTWEDWQRVNPTKFFPKSVYKNIDYSTIPKWEDKIDIAVFRGSSTGRGTTIEDNMRLKVSHLSNSKENMDENGKAYINAGITKWNIRPRKKIDDEYLSTITPIKEYEKEHMCIKTQSSYKYIINIDGHVTAFRISQELSLGSVVLLVKSNYNIWFMNLLEENVHYVSVNSDLSDLFEKVKWCRENDEECKKISENARSFYNRYLCKEGILDYIQLVLFNIRDTMGEYKYSEKSIFEIQLREKEELILSKNIGKNKISDKNTIITKLYSNKSIKQYGILKGVENVITALLNSCNKDEINKYIQTFYILKQTSKTIILNAKFNDISIVLKKSKLKELDDQYIHESFIGLQGVNELRKKIPNFIYTPGYYKEGKDNNVTIIQEKIVGQSLLDYINNVYMFKFDDFIFIMIQIMLSLNYAQERIGFVHWDLTPWNVIIEKAEKDIYFNYSFLDFSDYNIRTNLIPIIIDLGNSHIIKDGMHYGNVNKFKFSRIQDCISILIKSIKAIIKKEIKGEDKREDKIVDIIYMMNFISGSKYCNTKFSNIEQIIDFIDMNSDYSSILYSDKYELEEKTPLDFVKYMLQNDRYSFLREKININGLRTNYLDMEISSKHIFNYITSNNDYGSKLNSFLKVFSNIMKKGDSYPSYSDVLYNYSIAQSMKSSIDSMYRLFTENINEFQEKDRILMLEMYKKCDEYIYEKLLESNKDLEPRFIEFENSELVNYTLYNQSDRIFSDKRRLDILLKDVDFSGKDFSIYCFSVIDILKYDKDKRYILSDKTRLFYYNNFRTLFNRSSDMIKVKDLEARFNSVNYVYESLQI